MKYWITKKESSTMYMYVPVVSLKLCAAVLKFQRRKHLKFQPTDPQMRGTYRRSESVQTFSEILAQKLVYSEFLDFVVDIFVLKRSFYYFFCPLS